MGLKKLILNKKIITVISIIVLPTVLVVGYYGAKKITESIRKKRFKNLTDENADTENKQ